MSTVEPVAARQPLGELSTQQRTSAHPQAVVRQGDGAVKVKKPRATKPKKIKVPARRKATDVLPAEVFRNIFSFLDPPSLLELAVTTKQLRRMLMRGKKDALERIWRQALRNVRLHRDFEQKDWNLQQWAFALFANRCTDCGEKTRKAIEYNGRERLCSDCAGTEQEIMERRRATWGFPDDVHRADLRDAELVRVFEWRYKADVQSYIRNQRAKYILTAAAKHGYRSWDVATAWRELGESKFYCKLQVMTDRIWAVNQKRFLAACKMAQGFHASRIARGKKPKLDYDYIHTDSEASEEADLETLRMDEEDFRAGRDFRSLSDDKWQELSDADDSD